MSRTLHHGSWKPWVKRPSGAHWASMTPGWWTRLYMTRPKRTASRRLLDKIAADRLDADAVAFPLGNHKPHVYFW